MPTSPISGDRAAQALTSLGGSDKNKIDADTWLQLLVQQLKSQSPLDPMSPQDMMQQLSILEQTQQIIELKQTFDKFVAASQLNAGPPLIGREVVYLDDTEVEQTSKVNSVRLVEGSFSLVLADGSVIDPAAVREVR